MGSELTEGTSSQQSPECYQRNQNDVSVKTTLEKMPEDVRNWLVPAEAIRSPPAPSASEEARRIAAIAQSRRRPGAKRERSNELTNRRH